MAYFNNDLPIRVPDVSEAFKNVGDALTDVMKRRQERQQFEQEMQFKYADADRKYRQEQDNIRYQNRIIDERNRRERLEFNAKQQERAAAAAERARHAASPQEAEAILHGAVQYDPETGKEIGRGQLIPGQMRDVGPAPQAPTAPAFPAAEAGAVIPDIVQATPGMPPELAALMRGKARAQQQTASTPTQSPELEALMQRALPESSLDEAHRAELANLQAGHADRAGKVFVDRIDDEGNAFLFDENGNKQVVPATKDMQEGQWIAPPGSESVQRFDPSVQAARFESPTRGEDAAAAYSKYQQDRGTYEADIAALPGRQAAYAAEQRNAEAERPYTIKFGPNDPGTTFDFRTQRTAGRAQAAQDFLASLPDSMSDRDRAAAAQIHAGIQSGTIDPAKAGAMFQRERLTASGEAFRGGQGDLDRATKLQVAEINSHRPSADLGAAKFAYERERDRSKFLRDDLKQFLTKNAAKEIGDAGRETANLEKNLASKEPGSIRNGLLQLWRIAQHDNRMSDKDAVLANNLDQSVLSRLEGWVSTGAEGVPGDLNLKAAKDTAKRLRGYFVSKNEEMKQQYKDEFIDTGQYDPKEADVLGAQTFPGWTRLTENQPAPKGRGTGRKGAPPEIKAGGKSKDALKAKAQRALDDPNAPPEAKAAARQILGQ